MGSVSVPISTQTHTHAYTYTQTNIIRDMHRPYHTQTQKKGSDCTKTRRTPGQYSYLHAHKHTYTHTHAHTNTHAHTHTRTIYVTSTNRMTHKPKGAPQYFYLRTHKKWGEKHLLHKIPIESWG